MPSGRALACTSRASFWESGSSMAPRKGAVLWCVVPARLAPGHEERNANRKEDDPANDDQRKRRGQVYLKPFRGLVVRVQQHLHSNEGQHDRQSRLEVTEVAERPGQHKIE